VFGPYAAVKLCELTGAVVLDSLGQLDSCLSRWKELLDPITLAVVVSVLQPSCSCACALSCSGLVFSCLYVAE